ncbi:Ran GAP Rna1 [Diaporthe australafricana]|uniref:Ran GAP Rna1 n=1 Tax=Diaporthe australafricana TaxID=127596 RepID=A0ABR3X037_9PEZI
MAFLMLVALFFNQYGKLYHIRKLTLNNKVVKLDTREQILPYIIAINNLPLLEEISFAGSSLGIWAAYALADALRAKTKLRRADFSNCFSGRLSAELAPAVDALVSALLELPALEAISFADNAFGPDVQAPLARLVQSHTPLQELDISNIGLGPEAGIPFARALRNLAGAKARAGAAPLRTLLCSRNRLVQDDDAVLFGMAEWAAALAAHPQLRTVALGTNGLRREGMDVIVSQGLARVHGLEVLDLQDNLITARGRTHTALAKAVAGWPDLRVLDVNDSILGSRGAALLVAALADVKDSKLEVLKLVGNNINGANTAALASAFERLPSLREVELNMNNIPEDDAGYEALKRLLQERGSKRNIKTSLDDLEDPDYSQPSQPTPPGSQTGSPRAGAMSP